MPVTLYQSDGTLVPPVADARLYEMLSGGAVGIVQGCEITSLGGNQLQITSGWGVCLGRVFSVEQEVISASTSPSGEVDGRLIIAIDVSSGGTPIAFVTQAETPLPALVQEDINQDGTIYQIPMATYNINELAVSDLKTVYPKADVSGVGVYAHTRSGTVNELTGAGPNGRALMTADVQPGDTWTVNGQPVTAYMGTEDATDSMASQPYNGKWITFVIDGSNLNISGNGKKYVPPAYSTDPVDTGKKWIDGKTIWSKVINFTTPGSVTSYKNVPIGDTVETIVSLQTFCEFAPGKFSTNFSFSTASGTVLFGVSSAYSNDSADNKNTITVVVTYSEFTNKPGYSIIEYTKP